MQEHKRTLGYLTYLIGAALFSLNGTVSKTILETGISPARLSQFRVSMAFLIMLIFVGVTHRSALRLTRREIPRLLVYGIVGITMTQFLYFMALTKLPVGLTLLLEFTAPFMVALWMRFGRKEPIAPVVWLALAISMGGLAMVAQVWQGFTLDGLGVLYALGAAAALALFYVMSGSGIHGERPRDPVSLTMWGFGAAALFWSITQPWWSYPWGDLTGTAHAVGPWNTTVPLWILISYMVVLGTVVPFGLVVTAQKFISASQASVVGMSEPVLAIAFAWVLLGESLTAWQILGSAVVIGGIVLAENARK